ncbi:Hypothetical predicted protein [Paramuricea clavata]|uniref:Uncharacterized protein n=1 Tax=Paramuricea clavata TaxID=317549 RepID=A0A6S7GXJ7_PARCT|nr:Hypothetical predicted protein [Paramuricea clavata]
MFKYVSLLSLYYARLDFSSQHFHGSKQLEDNNTSEEEQEPGTSAEYENVPSESKPVPGLTRGVVRYQRDYMTTRPARNLWYDRLQLIRAFAMEWLRNAWGNVDELGRHVYDVMERVRHVFVPHNKLGNLQQDSVHKLRTG